MKIHGVFISRNRCSRVNTSKKFSSQRFKIIRKNILQLFYENIFHQLPGEKFGPGEHIIRYVATDLDDQSSKCEFTISVKCKRSYCPHWNLYRLKPNFITIIAVQRRIFHHNDVIKAQPLKNHESYLKCPGKPAVKIDTNFPVSRFRVFYRNIHQTSSKSSYSGSNNLPPKHYLTLFIDKVH